MKLLQEEIATTAFSRSSRYFTFRISFFIFFNDPRFHTGRDNSASSLIFEGTRLWSTILNIPIKRNTSTIKEKECIPQVLNLVQNILTKTGSIHPSQSIYKQKHEAYMTLKERKKERKLTCKTLLPYLLHNCEEEDFATNKVAGKGR